LGVFIRFVKNKKYISNLTDFDKDSTKVIKTCTYNNNKNDGKIKKENYCAYIKNISM
jgi:hypothetical protein